MNRKACLFLRDAVDTIKAGNIPDTIRNDALGAPMLHTCKDGVFIHRCNRDGCPQVQIHVDDFHDFMKLVNNDLV